jgi:hypothetical protein
MKRGITLALLAALALATAVPLSKDATAQQSIDPADFSSTITNPLLPLSLLGPKVFVGKEEDDEGDMLKTRLESQVLTGTTVVAGVRVLILEEKAYEDDELIEVALDYFAQHKNGDVYYFGERVDNYENGKLKNHDGQWLAGENGAQPGLFMPATPKLGETLSLELAPGIAEDKATVFSTTESVKVPAGSYTNCIKTREFTPLEPGIEEFKWHCPGAGLVKETGDGSVLELVSITLQAPAPATSTPRPSTTTVPAPTSATTQPAIRPPSTGDGGLLDDSGELGGAVLISVAVAACTALMMRLRRG